MVRNAPSIFKGFACFLFIVLASSFGSKYANSNTLPVLEDAGKKLITLQSSDFIAYSKLLYNQIAFDTANEDQLSYDVFEKAFRGYSFLKHTDELDNDSLLTVIDFTKHCNTKRMWVLNLRSKKVLYNEIVAHGKNTGNEYAKYFSNKHQSNKSSLGFYVTGGLYHGRNALSLKLNGLEQGFNSNAFTRGIVIHGANYISNEIANRNERVGRSYGCPAVSQAVNKKLTNTIKGGSCLFIYYPSENYLENSKLVNANLYLTVEDLSI